MHKIIVHILQILLAVSRDLKYTVQFGEQVTHIKYSVLWDSSI